ncbi:MAG: MucBP domain-containing protein, partial [Clostridia bacterium]|nr:MucBP domain-containing protein [Clostridia bacterium]
KTGIVEVVYVDEEGNELLKEEMSGKVDEEYKVVEKTIEKYKVKSIEGDKEGTYKIEKQIVKITMEKIRGTVKVFLFDQDGNLLGTLEGDGVVGETYEIELPEKEGYYIDGEKEISVEYVDGEIVINVNYVKIVEEEELIEPPATGDINVVFYIVTAFASIIAMLKVILKNSKN